MPVSRTANFTVTRSPSSCSEVTSTDTLPVGVNFTALPSRLVRICPSRSASPMTTGGTLGSM